VIEISSADNIAQLRIQYAEPLRIAQAHLKSGKKAKNRSSITEKRRKEMFFFKIECVHCGMILNKGNHNTEHILDISLGGDNSDTNRMLMCNACNSWRNELKTVYLGTDISAKDWPKVERYVLWNFLTVDYGHRAGEYILDVHQDFLNLRFGGDRDFEAPGKIWFARASDSTPKELASANPLRPSSSHVKIPKSSERFSKRLRRWLLGSDNDHIHRLNIKKSQSKPINERITDNNLNPDILSTILDEDTRNKLFRDAVRSHLPEAGDSKRLTEISNQVKGQDASNRSIKSIGIQLGFPESWTVTKMLQSVFQNDLQFEKIGGSVFVSLATTDKCSAPGTGVQNVANKIQPKQETNRLEFGEQTDRGTLVRMEIRKFLLAGEEIYLGAFAKKYYETTSTRLKSKISEFGFPKSWTILKSITTAFGPLMHVREDGREVYIQLADYQPCKNFNRSKGFMSYPQTPQLLRVFWDAYASSVPNTLGWLEFKAQLSETSGISRGRLLSPMMVLQRCLGGSQEQPVPWSAVGIATFVSKIRQAIDDADDEIFSNLEEEGIADWYLRSFQAIVEARGTEEE
jgi:hypothetical protein